jgi:hypothetical protein
MARAAFLLLPMEVGGLVRWLEWAEWEEELVGHPNPRFVPVRWTDIP